MNEVEKAIVSLVGKSLEEVDKKAKEQVKNKLQSIEKRIDLKIEDIKKKQIQLDDYISSLVADKPLVITLGKPAKPKKELVHPAFEKVVKILSSAKRKEKNIMFVGPAGSGKTHLAGCVAESLQLPFYPMSVGLQTTKSDLLGFVNAQGNYVTTPVREAYEKGGLLLLDEFDAAHAGVVTILNSLLANGHCSFADKIVTKHPDFVCVCACNTYGKGATMEYIGRNRLDAATLDRFIVVEVGYDKGLERALTSNPEWFDIISKVRENIDKEKIKITASPRALMDGADLLEQGFSPTEVLDMVVFKGVEEDVKAKALRNVSLNSISKREEPAPQSIKYSTSCKIRFTCIKDKCSMQLVNYTSNEDEAYIAIAGRTGDPTNKVWGWASSYNLIVGHQFFSEYQGGSAKALYVGNNVADLSKVEFNRLINSFRMWKSTVKANPEFGGNRENYIKGPWIIEVEIEIDGKIERFDISFDKEV